MKTLKYILKKYQLKPKMASPIRLNIKRYQMNHLFKELGFSKGAEIGVARGHFSEELCRVNPNLKMHCIDIWADPDKTIFAEAKKRLAPLNCKLIRKSSMEAVKEFAPQSLDFVYIDGDHRYQQVLKDLTAWSKIVRPDGIVSGHDYLTFKHPEIGVPVKRAIDRYIRNLQIKRLFLVNKNNQSNWFFIKEG